MTGETPVLRFGGSSLQTPPDEPPSTSSMLFQSFATWLGSVYAMEHELSLEPGDLAAFDPVDVMPEYQADADRARLAMEQGMTIEQSWLVDQLLMRRPSTCVLVDRYAGQPLSRVTRLRVASAEALAGEIVDRLARNFRFEGRNVLVAAFEDAYFEAAPPMPLGVLGDGGGHVVSAVSADLRNGEIRYQDPWPGGTLVKRGEPTETPHLYRIAGDDLAAVLVYALLPDAPPVERSPDIYAPSVRHEADPSKGAPLDVAWHAQWQLGGPSYCLIAEGADVGPVERIPYRAELPAAQVVALLADAFGRRDPFACVASVQIAPDRGHSVTLFEVGDDGVVFHDPWPEGSLLAAERNELGIDAQPDEGRWRITTAELERCLQAVFVDPGVLAEMQGREHRRTLVEVLEALGFFNVHEVRRMQAEGGWDVEAAPGGFQESVRVRFAVDDEDWLEAALLSVRRHWLQGPNQPFGIDIMGSFLGATVSPLDEPEAQLLIGAVRVLGRGLDALTEALAAGAPHLLGQAREFVTAVLGAQESALVTYAFTRAVAVNRDGDDPWLDIGVERAGRTGGPMFVDAQLPAPWHGR